MIRQNGPIAIITILSVLAFVHPGVAETEKVGDYTWQYFIRDGKAWIGSQVAETAAVFPKPVGEVTVPSELGGYEVYRIDDYALYGCDQMTKLVIPDSVCQMGVSAFRGCNVLWSVQLSANLESIAEWAFRDCATLKEVVVPASVRTIDEYAFSKCLELSSVSFAGSVEVIERCAFQDCALTAIDIPEGLTTIGDNAFLGCHSLTNAVIPNSVTNIGIYAFSYCNNLQSLTLPFIGSQRGNTGTEESVFGHLFGMSAYEGLTKVVQIYDGSASITRHIPTSLKMVRITDETILSSGSFRECNFLEEIVINDGVGKIEEGAFAGCGRLMNVEIPQSVTNIETKILLGCSSLKSLTIPFVGSHRGSIGGGDSVLGWLFATSSANGQNCIKVTQWFGDGHGRTSYIPSALQSVTVEDESLISFGAFQNCSNLTSVVIGNSVTNIAKGAFSGCGGLERISLPFTGRSRNAPQWADGDCECAFGYIFGVDSYVGSGKAMATVGDRTVSYQVPLKLADVSLTGLEQLRPYAFCYCSTLSNVTLNTGLKSIGHKAFHNCKELKQVEIPDSVNSIGPHSFHGSGLEYIKVPLSVDDMAVSEGWNFAECSSLHLAYIPRRFKGKLNENTFANCADDLQVIYYDENMKFFDETLATEDGSSTNIVAVCTNDCRVSFEWKCSCEPLFKNNPYDYLSFEIDGVRQDFICGETGWQTKSYEVSGDGEHSFRWIYQKDEQDSAGEDCGWVKHVVVAPRVTLAFDGGEATDGEAPAAMSFYADDETVTLPGCGTLYLAKHSFAGWSDGEKVYAAGAACPYQKTAQTLTAVWAANTLYAPVITAPETYEADSATVTIAADDGATVYYTLDGSTPVAYGTGCRPYQGPFEIEGSATIKAIAVKDDYFDSEVASFTVTRPTWTYGEYLNCPERMFTMGGNTEWVREKGVSADGYALRSGEVTHNQTSRLETVVYGAGTVAFRCKVDGEIVKKIVYDGLAFCVDGEQQGDLMGDVDWTEKSFTVTGDGRHVLSWLYVKDEEGNGGGEDCAWLDNVVWSPDDPLPPLDVTATDNDAHAIVAGLSDVRLSDKIGSTAAYTAFRNWVDSNGLSHALVKDAPEAWLSYALDAPALMAKPEPLTSEDVVIESIAPSSAADGAFDLTVSIGGVVIGEGARLAEALGVEGATELDESAFSSGGLTVSFDRAADGKAKATVTPDGAPASFFLRVRVR